MAIISFADYKAIVTDYTEALTQISGLSQNYFDAAYKVLLLNAFNPEIDLLVAYHNAYLTADVSYAAQPQSVVNAVTALQAHVLSQGTDKDTGLKFTGINDWFADEDDRNAGTFSSPAFFTSEFASLSQQAGYTITSDYII